MIGILALIKGKLDLKLDKFRKNYPFCSLLPSQNADVNLAKTLLSEPGLSDILSQLLYSCGSFGQTEHEVTSWDFSLSVHNLA